ncbi:MAG: hypothetical protein K2L19_08835, partial [Eubacterium sp.]|nr:hypothetical protein [Eubacterium sp.]
NNNYDDFDDSYEQTTEENEELLADRCQYVLATGYDADGTCYQLVGEDYESYDKSIIRFGVIKDNQWLVEMTSNVPFLDEYNCIYGGQDENGEYNLEGYRTLNSIIEKSDESNIFDRFGYIGNGCFYLKSNRASKTITIVEQLCTIVFWNAETNSQKIINNVIMSDTDYYNSDNDLLISVLADHLFAISNNQFADMDVQLLNTKNFETKTIFTQHFDINSSWSKYKVYQSSESLFYVEKDNSFYNINGNKEFELDFDNVQEMGRFDNGQCELITQVESGGRYRVVINTSGEVISNEKID